jgi:hypothetical protein
MPMAKICVSFKLGRRRRHRRRNVLHRRRPTGSSNRRSANQPIRPNHRLSSIATPPFPHSTSHSTPLLFMPNFPAPFLPHLWFFVASSSPSHPQTVLLLLFLSQFLWLLLLSNVCQVFLNVCCEQGGGGWPTMLVVWLIAASQPAGCRRRPSVGDGPSAAAESPSAAAEYAGKLFDAAHITKK